MKGDWIDKLLTIGATADWITPAIAIAKDLTKGKRCDFYLDAQAGFSVNDVKRLLRQIGIDHWGDMIMDIDLDNGHSMQVIVISVPYEDAEFAEAIFRRKRMPIVMSSS